MECVRVNWADSTAQVWEPFQNATTATVEEITRENEKWQHDDGNTPIKLHGIGKRRTTTHSRRIAGDDIQGELGKNAYHESNGLFNGFGRDGMASLMG